MMINQQRRIFSSRFHTKLTLKSGSDEAQIDAVITPAGAADLQKLPEGERFTDAFNVFTTAPLTVEDILVINDLDYGVSHLENWSQNGYYYAIATRLTATDRRYPDGFPLA